MSLLDLLLSNLIRYQPTCCNINNGTMVQRSSPDLSPEVFVTMHIFAVTALTIFSVLATRSLVIAAPTPELVGVECVPLLGSCHLLSHPSECCDDRLCTPSILVVKGVSMDIILC